MNEHDVLLRSNHKKKRKWNKKRVATVLGSLAVLLIIFFASFSWSYYKITAEKNTDKGADKKENKVSLEQRIKELERELTEKEEKIESLELQIERYEKIIEDMKSGGRTSSSSGNSSSTTPKPTQSPTSTPKPTPAENKNENVHGSVYKRN